MVLPFCQHFCWYAAYIRSEFSCCKANGVGEGSKKKDLLNFFIKLLKLV